MYCPNCGVKADTKFCPNCGTRLEVVPPAAPAITTPPPGKYESATGYILLREHDLVLHKKPLFKVMERVIAYTDIVAISFQRAQGMGLGYISLRERKDALIPLATSGNAAADETALCFGAYQNDIFYNVYCALKPFAHSAAPVPPPQDADTQAACEAPPEPAMDLEPYFQRHYPGRMEAIKALHHDTGLSLAESKQLIDSYFDANKHRAPVRDLNPGRELTRQFSPKKAAFADKRDELEKSDQAYCPKCLSTSVTARKQGFSLGRAAAGSLVSPLAGLAAGASGSKKAQCVCLKCGHAWKPK